MKPERIIEHIDVACPRCGRVYHVGMEKAGKKGHCPQCGGIMHVPEKPAEHPEHPVIQFEEPRNNRVIVFGALGGVLLLAIVIVLVVVLSKDESAGTVAEEPLPPELEAKVRDLSFQINRLEQIESRLANFEDISREELILRARDILRKDKAYEPVSQQEYRLRSDVVAEESVVREEYAKKNLAAPNWRLDEPTTSEERAKLELKSAEMVKESELIATSLARNGVKAVVTDDPFGRKLIDTGNARKAISVTKDRIRAMISEAKSSSNASGK